MNTVEIAKSLAEILHGEQKRKYTGVPYVTHTQAVAEIVREQGLGVIAESIAHLHDVLEDTPTTAEKLNNLLVGLGVNRADTLLIVSGVIDLTDVFSDPAFGNRAKRKAAERERLAHVNPRSQAVKLADLIDNAKDIKQNDPNFAKVFLREARELLKVIGNSNERLAHRLAIILE